jgi:hypothetical protein
MKPSGTDKLERCGHIIQCRKNKEIQRGLAGLPTTAIAVTGSEINGLIIGCLYLPMVILLQAQNSIINCDGSAAD